MDSFKTKNINDSVEVVFGNQVDCIPSYMFEDCVGLTQINIPENIKKIDKYAFRGCTGLTSITIPEGVTHIKSSAFFGQSGKYYFCLSCIE